MKLIPFRIEPHPEPDNYADVYKFLVQGTIKEAYEVEIDVDDANDLGVTDTRCTCPHATYREVECKHIITCKSILEEYGVRIQE